MPKYAVLSAGLIAGAQKFETQAEAEAYAERQCERDRGPRAVVTVVAEARTESKPKVDVTRFDRQAVANG